MVFELEEVSEPVSPTGQYMSSSVLSLSIISVLDLEVPFDDLHIMSLLKTVFLPINPRFSSIMVTDENGVKRWKAVEVKLKNHVNVPIFPPGMSTKFYDECLDDYLSQIAMEKLQQSQPLWEVHLIKYPTSQAASNIIFKFHHSLGDGFSLMGALLSCFQRADNPSLPLTLPSVQSHANKDGGNIGIFSGLPKLLSSVYNTLSDFSSSIMKSILIEDDKTPVRSGHSAMDLLSVSIVTMTFSLDHIKQIKTKLGATINDVITGTIFLGTRLYMQSVSQGSENACTTSVVLLNTRIFSGYTSIKEMVKPDSKMPWGNHFAFLNISVPKLSDAEANNPLQFVWRAQQIIKSKRSSLAVYLTARYLQLVKKLRGTEAASNHLYGTLYNTSMAITNVMGPVEKMAMVDYPVSGLYFVVTGCPQSLMVGIVSYMGKLRVAVQVEKGFIDPQKFKAYTEHAFDLIFKAACGTPPPAN